MPFIGHRTCADWKHESDRPVAQPLVVHESRVRALIEAGVSVAHIANRFSVSPSAVHNFARRHGLNRRAA